jgi:tRNA (cytidine/uridine-2'-O-)-methyltransferase
MFEIVLFEPEIPPNTGNIIRLCANTSARLHLVGPCGFNLDEPQLRRAGLDYHDIATVRLYQDWSEFRRQHPRLPLWAFSTRGQTRYDQVNFSAGDGLLFGPESRGLPASLLDSAGRERVLRLPMQAQSRSLNLSNAVAIALYEALRQHGFGGLD